MVSKEQNFDMVDISRLKYHEALLALKRNDEDMARYNLRSIINMEWMEPELLAQALRVYGNWVAENKSENPQVQYFYYFCYYFFLHRQNIKPNRKIAIN